MCHHFEKVFCCWSGGKDSALALYKARAAGLDVCALINMITGDAKRSSGHGLCAGLLSLQAQASGIPLIQKRSSWENYEEDLKNVVLQLKRQGIKGGVFGDIDLEEHRAWTENFCKKTGIMPYLPLWGKDQVEILKDFISSGFEAIIVAVRDKPLAKMLGRKIDLDLVQDLLKLGKSITPCGEHGEYHSFVYNGPLFHQPIKIVSTKKIKRNNCWFLEIKAKKQKRGRVHF